MPSCKSFMGVIVLFSSFSGVALHADEPVELTVTPRAVEQPLLKYRLLPAEFELQDGNAAPVLLRMIWDQVPYLKSIYGTLDQDLKLPLDDPQLLANGTRSFGFFYDYMKDAAYLRSADWEYPIRREHPMAYILLPDAQGAREMVGRGLSVWIRYHIAKGELDKAREGIGVGLAVSRHYSQTPFVIIQLVSQALDAMMFDRLEELIVQPDSPNLYWSLTALPHPLHDTRRAIEFEERMLEFSLAGLTELDDTWTGDLAVLRKIRPDELDHLDDPRTQEEWDALYHAIFYLYAESGGIRPLDKTELDQLRQRIIDKARQELPGELSGGAERVQKMSDAEAAVRWFATRHRALSQEITATLSLSPKQAIPELRALQDRIKNFREENGLRTLFNLENPLNLYVNLRRNDRRIALLRVIEGLRHYAANHDGRLPYLLVDLKETPAPDDPLLEKPFEYEFDGEMATLTAPGIEAGDTKLAEYVYKIKVRKP